MTEPLLHGLSGRPCKVALLRASRIGDFVCATPAFRAFRNALPEAEITLIALPMVRDLAARCPHLNRFSDFPGYPGIAEQLFSPRRALEFFARMQAETFDLVVQMHGSGIYSNPVALMMGGRQTAGFVVREEDQGLLDAALAYPCERHEVDRVLALAAFLGAPTHGLQATEFPLWPEDKSMASALLAGLRRPLIGMQAGARDTARRWPLERFQALCTWLEAATGGTAVSLGCEGAAQMDVGVVPLPVLGALIEELDLLVTNDSGPAHIAYALGTPSVTLFGPTHAREWGPQSGNQHVVVTAPDGDLMKLSVTIVAPACLHAMGIGS